MPRFILSSGSGHSDSSYSSVSSTSVRSKSSIPDPDPEHKNSDRSSTQSESLLVADYKQELMLKELSVARCNIRIATQSLELLKQTCLDNTETSTDDSQSSEDSLEGSLMSY